jgi:aspartokinase-like uncharacterized kinase
MSAVWVVKLGGSLAETDTLAQWLKVAASDGRGRVVVVPGGGAFAEQVRSSQARWRFDDSTAHHMALLAMEQFGLMLQGLCPALVPVSTAEEAVSVLQNAATPIWMPSRMVLNAPEIARSWDVTSDSLAAWFAKQLGASHLVLVKSATLSRQSVPAQALRDGGVVDRAFPNFVKKNSFTTLLLGRADHELLEGMLRAGGVIGTRVLPN